MVAQFPLVSVIIPVFNRQHFLGDAIQSILDTNYPNLEILVVDDGSQDESPEVAESWHDRYPDIVRFIQHADKSNHGISASRNLGITQSNGEFITFLDSDDVFLSNRFECCIHFLKQNSELLAVYEPVVSLQHCDDFIQKSCDWILLKSLSKYPAQGEFDRAKVFQNLLYGYNGWNTPAITLRRQAFTKIGLFRERFNHSEDTHLWLRLAATEQVQCAQDAMPVSLVRIHTGNMTSIIVNEDKDLILFNVYMDVYRMLLKTSDSKKVSLLESRINSFITELMMQYCEKKRKNIEVLQLFGLIVKEWPKGLMDKQFLINFLFSLRKNREKKA